MPLDSKTNTILVGPNSDFIADSGVFFVRTLQTLANDKNTSPSIRNDWKIVEDWLSCAGRDLVEADNLKVAAGWRAYIAMGVAPSEALQETFDKLSVQYRRRGIGFQRDRPPTEVMNVFDRLLATDADIKAKNGKGRKTERQEFEAIFGTQSAAKPLGWWRRQTKPTRAWLFGSIIWALLVLVVFVVFDPHNYGNWNYMSSRDYAQMILIMSAPLIAGLIKNLYERIVA